MDKLILKNDDIVLGKYKVSGKIASGGTAEIYSGENINSNQKVAIKVVSKDKVDEEDWEKFIQETITSKRIKGKKNLVQTYDIDINYENGNGILIVMEFLDGITLRQYLDIVSKINPDEAMSIFHQTCIAVNELHSWEQKLIHRDLKPENIMLTNNKRDVKIIDFGAGTIKGKRNRLSKNDEILSHEKSIYATYPYTSPDLLPLIKSVSEKGKIKYDPSLVITENLDFFALGVILYEMLTGKRPFEFKDESDTTIIKLPLKYDARILSASDNSVSPIIDNIIFRCIASKDVDKYCRYISCSEILEDVNQYLYNKEETFSIKLIKPANERVYQPKISGFNIENEERKIPKFEKGYIYGIFMIILVVVLAISIILHFVNF